MKRKPINKSINENKMNNTFIINSVLVKNKKSATNITERNGEDNK